MKAISAINSTQPGHIVSFGNVVVCRCVDGQYIAVTDGQLLAKSTSADEVIRQAFIHAHKPNTTK